ncbi:MAG: hypothetical protein HY815_12065 [Candidatus Riflebacteria bacterium]|nr:hypothetical protein [Candidatus Riflebacteria bacterium]
MRATWTTVLCLVLAVGISAAQSPSPGWKVDLPVRLQLVYLQDETAAGGKVETTTPAPLLGHIPAHEPDIKNIVYKEICGLGFPLPARKGADKLKLYLKLYEFPKHLDPVLSFRRIFDAFHLWKMPNGRLLYDPIASRDNLSVKVAYIGSATRTFDRKNPLPPPAIPVASGRIGTLEVTPQDAFDGALPFSSVYVNPADPGTPKTDDERAARSAGGVLAFHQELLETYQKFLSRVSGDNHLFVQPLRCFDNIGQLCGLRVIEVPRKPIVLTNYRQAQMPQDPAKVFLTGLLLLKVTDYAARKPLGPGAPMPGAKGFDSAFKPVYSHLLEVASVVDLR